MPVPRVQILDTVPPARELQPGETRLLILRHPEHKDNIPAQEALERLRRQGRDLAALGYVPDVVISSPAFRAVEAGFHHVCGVHDYQGDDALKLPYVHTENTIADFGFGTNRALLRRIKAYHRASGATKGDDEPYWQYLGEDDEFLGCIQERGMRAATALRGIVRQYEGKTILVPSHGISTIETAVTYLRSGKESPTDEDLFTPPVKLARCQIVEVILGPEFATVDINYFPVP